MSMLNSLIFCVAVAGQSFGFGQRILNGKLLSIQAANVFVVEARISTAPGRTRIRRAALHLYGLESPRKGRPGYDAALRWAKATFKGVTDVQGRTFGDFKSGALAELYFGRGMKAMDPPFSLLLTQGMGRYSEAAVPDYIRSGPHFAQWRRGCLDAEAVARKAKKGLWATVWK